MLTLYHFPYSQHARRVAALLEQAGLDHRLEHVALDEGAHRAPAYLAVNPNGQVPTLVDGDLVVHESNAILRYLCNEYGLTEWYPADSVTRARVDQWLDWNQCRLSPVVVDIVFNAVFAGPDADTSALGQGRSLLPDRLAIVNATLERFPYLAGSQPSIADLSMISNVTHLELSGDAPAHPAIRAWRDRMCAIEGCRKHLPPGVEV